MDGCLDGSGNGGVGCGACYPNSKNLGLQPQPIQETQVFAGAGVLISASMIKFTPELAEVLILAGIVESLVTAAVIVIGAAIIIPFFNFW